MAVQLATPSSQDMMNFGVGTGAGKSTEKHGGPDSGVFLDSESSTRSFAQTLDSMSKGTRKSEKGAFADEAVDAESVEAFASLVEPAIKKSPISPMWQNSLENENGELGIEAMLASFKSRGKKGKFDPDAILKETEMNVLTDSEQQTDAVKPESEFFIPLIEEEDESNEEKNADPSEEERAATLLAAQLAATAITDEVEPVEPLSDSTSDSENIEKTVDDNVKTGKTPSAGEALLKEEAAYQPVIGDPEGTDVFDTSETMLHGAVENERGVVDSSQTEQETESSQTARTEAGQQPSVREISPQNEKADQDSDAAVLAAEATDELLDATVSADAKKSGDTSEDATKAEGGKQAEGESIEELLARYRQERESRQDDSSNRNSSNQSRRDRKSSAASAQARNQRTESSAYGSVRDAREDAPKTGAFAENLANSIKNARDDLSPAQNASANRSGTAYILNREMAFSDGVNTVLEFMRTDGTTEARIVVEPPALGHIDVSLRATSVGMEATFKVDNEHLRQMLQQQLDILKSSLESQGIHVSALAVDIRNKDDQRGREATNGNGKKSRHVGGADDIADLAEEETSLVRLDLEKGLLHWVA